MKNFLLKNKFYVGSAIFFVIWEGFVDFSSIKNQFVLWNECREIENNIEYFEKELETVKRDKANIFGSMKAVETYAREKYLMKKKDEIVFVLVDENGQFLEDKQ